MAGAAALAAWWAKPAVARSARAPTSLQPRPGARSHRRPRWRAWPGWAWRKPAAGPPGASPARLQRSTPAGDRFAPRRDTCPWCRSPELAVRLTTTDLLQHKPGVFVLDECRACGQVFQNPQLSPAGLDAYYDQFYDGLGGELMTQLFATGASDNARRIAAVAAAAEATGTHVRRWLDVGTGHGHFPLAARRRWPASSSTASTSAPRSRRRPPGVGRTWRTGACSPSWPATSVATTSSPCTTTSSTPATRSRSSTPPPSCSTAGLLEVEVPDAECPMSRVLGR